MHIALQYRATEGLWHLLWAFGPPLVAASGLAVFLLVAWPHLPPLLALGIGVAWLASWLGLVFIFARRRGLPWGVAALGLSPSALGFVPLLLLIPDFLSGPTPPGYAAWAALGLAVIGHGAMVAVLWRRVLFVSEPFKPPWQRALWMLLGLYTLGMATFAVVSQQRLDPPHGGAHDVGAFLQMFWTTAHGYGLFYSSDAGTSQLGAHNVPILFLLFPFYLLFPSPLTLFTLQSLALAGAAVPLYLLAKGRVGTVPAAFLVAGFLLYPFYVNRHVATFIPDSFLPLFFLWAVYFLERNSLGWYVLFLVLMLTIKETFAVLALVLGLYALLRGRGVRWFLATWLVAALSVLTSFWVIRFFGGDESILPSIVELAYGQFGRTPGEVLFNMLTHPDQVLALILRRESLSYVYALWQPLGGVPPLLSPQILLALPDFLQNLLSQSHGMRMAQQHYNVALSAALFLGLIYSLPKIAGWRAWSQGFGLGQAQAALLLSMLVFFSSLSTYYRWWSPSLLPVHSPYAQGVERALAQVPPLASVAVPNHLSVHVAQRPELYFLWRPPDSRPRGFPEYVVLDSRTLAGVKTQGLEDRVLQQWLGLVAREYVAIYHEEEVDVYRRQGAPKASSGGHG